MKFAQIKVQRALWTVKLSQDAQFMEIPREHGEQPGAHEVHVQLSPHLPRNQQPAPITVRNGNIFMISRNVPGKSIMPGNVLLLDLRRAASVKADDTYEVASVEDVEAFLRRCEQYRKDMQERDRQLRMQSQGIEVNNTVSPSNVTVKVELPAGYSLTPDAPRRRGRARTASGATTETTIDPDTK